MCAAALSALGIRRAFYGCSNPIFGGCGTVLPVNLYGCGTCGARQHVPKPTQTFPAAEEGWKGARGCVG